eukprot:6749724-Prymnesium_polylepis.1
MPHDVYDFACTVLTSLKKRKLGDPEEEANVSRTVSLLAHQIQTLYTIQAMIEKGYRMAFVMLSSDHDK